MQDRLAEYYNTQSDSFISNFVLALNTSEPEAVHDMRVAVKRIRAVFLLLEKLYPSGLKAATAEGQLRELFRISGRMRDAQVQQQLVADTAAGLSVSFGEYQKFLSNLEAKAARRFRKFMEQFDAISDLAGKNDRTNALIRGVSNDQIRHQVVRFAESLLLDVKTMRANQEHDEYLHEIRRRLKQCQYLLSVFRPDDHELPQLCSTIKKLDKLNQLLGDWHDLQVGMELMDRFLIKFREKDTAGETRYLLLYDQLKTKRRKTHLRILAYFNEKMEFQNFGSD